MKIEYLASLPDVITKEIFNHFSDEDLDDLYKQAVRLKLPVYPYKNIPTFQKVRQLWKKMLPKRRERASPVDATTPPNTLFPTNTEDSAKTASIYGNTTYGY